MTDTTPPQGANKKHSNSKNPSATPEVTDSAASKSPTGARANAPQPASITVKGQKYVAPAGRHSQQVHRIADERATANGHSTEKEQHAADRDAVKSKIEKRAQQLLDNRSGAQKAKAASAPQGTTE